MRKEVKTMIKYLSYNRSRYDETMVSTGEKEFKNRQRRKFCEIRGKKRKNFTRGKRNESSSETKLMQNEMRNRRETRNRSEKIRIQMIQNEKDKNFRENKDNSKT